MHWPPTRSSLIVAALLILALVLRVAEVQRTAYRPVNDAGSYLTLASQIAHTGDYSRQVVKPSVSSPAAPHPSDAGVETEVETGGTHVATEEAPKALDWHGTRRAPRFRVRSGVELQLDGNPASIVDLSTIGAQVISPTVLRPNQKVRINLPNDDFMLRFRGAIAWAKFELPTATAAAPQYRAGVEFVDADAKTIDSVIAKNRQ